MNIMTLINGSEAGVAAQRGSLGYQLAEAVPEALNHGADAWEFLNRDSNRWQWRTKDFRAAAQRIGPEKTSSFFRYLTETIDAWFMEDLETFMEVKGKTVREKSTENTFLRIIFLTQWIEANRTERVTTFEDTLLLVETHAFTPIEILATLIHRKGKPS